MALLLWLLLPPLLALLAPLKPQQPLCPLCPPLQMPLHQKFRLPLSRLLPSPRSHAQRRWTKASIYRRPPAIKYHCCSFLFSFFMLWLGIAYIHDAIFSLRLSPLLCCLRCPPLCLHKKSLPMPTITSQSGEFVAFQERHKQQEQGERVRWELPYLHSRSQFRTPLE